MQLRMVIQMPKTSLVSIMNKDLVDFQSTQKRLSHYINQLLNRIIQMLNLTLPICMKLELVLRKIQRKQQNISQKLQLLFYE